MAMLGREGARRERRAGRAGHDHRRLAPVGLRARRRRPRPDHHRAVRVRRRRARRGGRGREPDRHLPRDLRGLRPELAVPVGDGRRPDDRRAEPAADADPDRAADPHRASPSRSPSAPACSTSAARASTSSAPSPRSTSARRSTARRRCCTSCSRSSPPAPAAPLWAGIAGVLKATTGANEVISTIMLNWTAVYVGLYLFGLGGPLHSDDPAAQSIPVSERRARERAAAGVLGRPGAAGPAHRHLHRARGDRAVLGAAEPLGDRATRSARSASTPTRPSTAASAPGATTSRSC